ncbi:3-phenylpropionate MFS transporter [Photobacterium leiognathi subsp. mandapamensis]|uniref:3-phenylpropionate MFS transporter n=1 Tax=Photobacterium leiognathi TaxID=553611 RepID=UPI003AF34B29
MFNRSPYSWNSQYLWGFFFSYGVYLPFWAIWFKHIGVNDSDIGLLLGLGFAVRCIANLVITPRIHKVEYLIPALRGFTLLGLVACIIYIVCGGNLWALAAVTILFNLSAGPIVPISDAIVNHYAKGGLLDYGRTRLWGSIAFIAGSTIVGLLANHYGADIIPWVALSGLAFSQIMAARNPSVMLIDEETQEQVRPALWVILRNSAVIKLMVIAALLHGSHAAYYGFSSIYWQKIGFDESVIGYLWSFSVAAEVVVFLVSKRLFSGWSVHNMFRLAAFGVMVRWGLMATLTDQWLMFPVQALHGVTFAAVHLATIRYIQQQPSSHSVALQSLYNAIPLGAVMAILTSASGWMYGSWGANVFWVMAAMAFPVFFIRMTPTQQAATEYQASKA